MTVLPYEVYSNRKLLAARGIVIQPKASLYIGFYNSPDFFDLVFASIEAQRYKDFEVIICDDGSGAEVVHHVRQKLRNTNVLARHVWQPDAGFHKVECLNKGLANSTSDYAVFIDQDCVLHPEFMGEHIRNRAAGQVLAGRRLEFSPFTTNLLTPENIKQGFIQRNLFWMIPLILGRVDNQARKGIYLRNPALRAFANRRLRPVVGCNFSVGRAELQAVNGFDMRYVGPGFGEDSDIEYRLNLNGVRTRSFIHAAVQYHLYHSYRERPTNNRAIFVEVQAHRQAITPYGLNLIQPSEVIELEGQE